jgi:serine/threonine protein kinase
LEAFSGAGTPLAERLAIFVRICDAVAFAHAAGVVHRDLKPENVMVGEYGEVLVLDWGVAKRLAEAGAERREDVDHAARNLVDAGPPVWMPAVAEAPPADADTTSPADVETRDGTILGTPAYMAPEQRRGDVDAIDARADIWALGALLRFLLTGQPPLAAPPPGVRVPRALDAICRKAMAEEPVARYARVEVLRDEVRRFQAGERVQADRESRARQAARLAMRYRVPLLVVFAYLLVRAVLLVAFRR